VCSGPRRIRSTLRFARILLPSDERRSNPGSNHSGATEREVCLDRWWAYPGLPRQTAHSVHCLTRSDDGAVDTRGDGGVVARGLVRRLVGVPWTCRIVLLRRAPILTRSDDAIKVWTSLRRVWRLLEAFSLLPRTQHSDTLSVWEHKRYKKKSSHF